MLATKLTNETWRRERQSREKDRKDRDRCSETDGKTEREGKGRKKKEREAGQLNSSLMKDEVRKKASDPAQVNQNR